MNTTLYQIHWRRTSDGRQGIGPKQFPETEAHQLCSELNRDHPEMEHVVMPAGTTGPQFKSAPVVLRHAPAPDAYVPMTDHSAMPFGVHEGKTMLQVPSDYLSWCEGQSWLEERWPALWEYIQRNKKAIDQDIDRASRK